MQLVFIHGWGCEAPFWDALAERLKDFPQQRVERDFFGKTPQELQPAEQQILIGHSLGFMHGLSLKQDWAGWVAINGFARFVGDCVPGFALKEMRRRLGVDTDKTLRDFYKLIGGEGHMPAGSPDLDRLTAGLDQLRDLDMTDAVKAMVVPGLVMASANDPLVPKRTSEALAKLAPSAALEWGAKGGHMLPLTDPDWCAAVIREYLAPLR